MSPFKKRGPVLKVVSPLAITFCLLFSPYALSHDLYDILLKTQSLEVTLKDSNRTVLLDNRLGPEASLAFLDQDLVLIRPFSLPDGPILYPEYDPTSGAFYGAAFGCLLRLQGHEAQVILDGVQGRDITVRLSRQEIVSREPDHSIVLWNLKDGSRRVVLEGQHLFRPVLSPDGSLLLVHQSQPGGGLIWVIRVSDAVPLALLYGSDGAWFPDNKGIVFTRPSHDGSRVTSADLFVYFIEDGAEVRLTNTEEIAEVEPKVSPDGRFVACVDARSGRLCALRLQESYR